MKYQMIIMCSRANKLPNHFSVVSRTRPFNVVSFEDGSERFQIPDFNTLIVND